MTTTPPEPNPAPPNPPAPPTPPNPAPPNPPAPPTPPNPPAPPTGPPPSFPANTPVEQMTVEQQAAYWKHYARQHEERAGSWATTFGGKTPAEAKAEMDRLAQAQMTEQERAIEAAKAEGRKLALAEVSPGMATLAFESVLSHVEENRRKVLIDSVDLTKVIKEDGSIDTDKVKSMAEALAPSAPGRGGGGTVDYGGGSRTQTPRSGLKAGAERYDERHKRTSTTTP